MIVTSRVPAELPRQLPEKELRQGAQLVDFVRQSFENCAQLDLCDLPERAQVGGTAFHFLGFDGLDHTAGAIDADRLAGSLLRAQL
ncbi:hypothetical protein AB0F17_13455 [Nonomuraea sp. NPDC026600]|uniref:hypothetical protein n=1 Tax=Nonomuraea sp. NPDC026600 TaxID=3155363 RepID=UPI0033DB7B5C